MAASNVPSDSGVIHLLDDFLGVAIHGLPGLPSFPGFSGNVAMLA
jgi:hypothetical protein